jgi:hypothetical protein
MSPDNELIQAKTKSGRERMIADLVPGGSAPL